TAAWPWADREGARYESVARWAAPSGQSTSTSGASRSRPERDAAAFPRRGAIAAAVLYAAVPAPPFSPPRVRAPQDRDRHLPPPRVARRAATRRLAGQCREPRGQLREPLPVGELRLPALHADPQRSDRGAAVDHQARVPHGRAR